MGAFILTPFDVLFLGGCHERLLAVNKQAFGMEFDLIAAAIWSPLGSFVKTIGLF
jgi:hypothetical protein